MARDYINKVKFGTQLTKGSLNQLLFVPKWNKYLLNREFLCEYFWLDHQDATINN